MLITECGGKYCVCGREDLKVFAEHVHDHMPSVGQRLADVTDDVGVYLCGSSCALRTVLRSSITVAYLRVI